MKVTIVDAQGEFVLETWFEHPFTQKGPPPKRLAWASARGVLTPDERRRIVERRKAEQ